jgi:hypothetical protein
VSTRALTEASAEEIGEIRSIMKGKVDMNQKQIIQRTISRWADGIGIVSSASQQKLSESLIKALEEHEAAKGGEQPTPTPKPRKKSTHHILKG